MTQVNQFSHAFEDQADELCLLEPSREQASEAVYSFGGFRLQADGALLRGSDLVHLPPKELAALRLLLAHAGQIVTPAHLKRALWGEVHVTTDSVPRCLSSLRSRLEPEDCIQTIYKQGYRITADVKVEGAPAVAVPPRLAILPLSAGPYVPEYLGAAIADETIAEMVSIGQDWATLLARDSVFLLASQGLSSIEIGRTLEADLALTGSIAALATHYRLRAEMIRISDGVQIWVEDLIVPQNRDCLLAWTLVERLLFRLGASSRTAGGRITQPKPAVSTQRLVRENLHLSNNSWKPTHHQQLQDGLRQLDCRAEAEYSQERTAATR